MTKARSNEGHNMTAKEAALFIFEHLKELKVLLMSRKIY